ncbi:MAG: 5-(carboxyamino)imidazole ribonucleotide mutase [Acidimicrobiales bacterium]
MGSSSTPSVGVIMGSHSDLDLMAGAMETLENFEVPYEVRVLSAHRTPDLLAQYAKSAKERGLSVIIAGAGGSAHLAGVTASHTTLPVISVPIKRDNHGNEALWSNIKMPPGVPLATMPENGSVNAALFAVRVLALSDAGLSGKYDDFKQGQVSAGVEIDRQLQAEGWQAALKDLRSR